MYLRVYLENKNKTLYGAVNYGTENIVNNTVIIMCGAGGLLDLLG